MISVWVRAKASLPIAAVQLQFVSHPHQPERHEQQAGRRPRHHPDPRLLAVVHNIDHHVEVVVIRDVEGDFARGDLEGRPRVSLAAVEDEARGRAHEQDDERRAESDPHEART
jgi:hypothetical protein